WASVQVTRAERASRSFIAITTLPRISRQSTHSSPDIIFFGRVHGRCPERLLKTSTNGTLVQSLAASQAAEQRNSVGAVRTVCRSTLDDCSARYRRSGHSLQTCYLTARSLEAG